MTAEEYQMHTLAALKSIDATLKELLTLSKSKRAAANQAAAPASTVASDSELDSEWGDEVLKVKMPKDWTGDDYKGAHMSEAPHELLDLYAARCDWFAQQNDEKGEKDDKGRPKSFYDKQTARRARGWAARKRAGWKPPAQPVSQMPSDKEISW